MRQAGTSRIRSRVEVIRVLHVVLSHPDLDAVSDRLQRSQTFRLTPWRLGHEHFAIRAAGQ